MKEAICTKDEEEEKIMIVRKRKEKQYSSKQGTHRKESEDNRNTSFSSNAYLYPKNKGVKRF